MPEIQPVILSGGAGTRLWPASRANNPKQLLSLTGEGSLLQATALRLRGRPGVRDRAIVVANDAHHHRVVAQLEAVGAAADLVLEPAGRNTAPAVALAALVALDRGDRGGPMPLLLVMPADHVIEKRDAFLAAVEAGAQAAAEGSLVLFGVAPSYPHTGYGYIEADATSGRAAPIRSFAEKPDQKTAVRLLETNRFFWNSGIFLLRADAYLDELEAFEPAMVAACRQSIERAATDGDVIRPDAEAFAACPSNSIDYAVMERTARAAMVPMTAGWSDVGTWSALHDVSPKDADGNTIAGDVLAAGCTSSYLSATSRVVAAVGLENVVVVEDRDAVLVAHRDQVQDVKAIVERLRQAGRPEADRHPRVPMPWGSEDCLEAGEDCRIRRLVVDPGAALPPADAGAGHWVVVRGTALVTRGDEERTLAPRDAAAIRPDERHRIANPGPEPLHLVAVQPPSSGDS